MHGLVCDRRYRALRRCRWGGSPSQRLLVCDRRYRALCAAAGGLAFLTSTRPPLRPTIPRLVPLPLLGSPLQRLHGLVCDRRYRALRCCRWWARLLSVYTATCATDGTAPCAAAALVRPTIPRPALLPLVGSPCAIDGAALRCWACLLSVYAASCATDG